MKKNLSTSKTQVCSTVIVERLKTKLLQFIVSCTMKGRIFLVTGATSGIGKHTATRLANTGATVLVHGRDPARVEGTVLQLKKACSNQNITGYVADLSKLSAVRKLSDDLHASVKHIDVLINNAGVFETSRKESEDGFELTFAVNVLAPFLLNSLLLDLLVAGKQSRIINVSSVSQASYLDFNNMQLKTGYGNGHKAYEQSKLCDVMFTIDMAERFKKYGITVNCMDPGTVNTKMLIKAWGEIGITIDEADDEFHFATDPKFERVTGKYFVGLCDTRAASVAYDQQIRSKLWQHLVEMTSA